MTLSKRFSMALAALVLVVLTGASSAFAQSIPFNVLTTPTEVANTGLSEVLGQVTLNADFTCVVTPCSAPTGTIRILYVGTDIDSDVATADINTVDTNGIEVCETPPAGLTTCNTAGFYLTGVVTVANTAAGGVVSFTVNAVLVGSPMPAGYQVVVRGVRGKIAQSPGASPGASIVSQLTTSPSTIAGFQPTSEVVARSADPLEVQIDGGSLIQCDPDVTIELTITEGFNTAFVDHDADGTVDANSPTLNLRPSFGSENNSHVNIVITDLPSGVEITWPSSVSEDGGVDSDLFLIDQSTNGDEAEYVFSTEDQGESDNNVEVFIIILTEADIDLSGDSSDFGSSTGQAQMFPPDTSGGEDDDENNGDEDRPRYDHDLENDPGDDFLSVGPCTTNLLYPWVANFAGFDFGIAISNTSSDPYGTEPQTGTCEVNLFPTSTTTSNGVSDGDAITITTTPVEPGSVWRSTMSAIPTFAGKAGYIIAICQFQYGHGFGFFTDRFGVGAANTAQGYIALIIPDPEITSCDRSATPDGDVCGDPSGESLGE